MCCVAACQLSKLIFQELLSTVEGFGAGLQAGSRRRRLWTAFKAASHGKHVQKFRESLNEMKASLVLAMVHEKYEQNIEQTSIELTVIVSFMRGLITSLRAIVGICIEISIRIPLSKRLQS